MPCLTCGTEFAPRRRDHRYCSAKCRLRAFEAKREANRDAQVRMLLLTALDAVQEARELLTGAAQQDTPE